MRILRLVALLLYSTSFHGAVHAQMNDDFGAGLDNWTPLNTNFQFGADGNPVLDADGNPIPQPWGPGTFDTSSNELTFKTSGPLPPVPDAEGWNILNAGFMAALNNGSLADPVGYSNGIVRSQVRIDSPQSAASIIVRGDPTTFSGYVFYAGAGTGQVGFERYENGVSVRREAADLGVDIGETWNLEGLMIGNEFALTAWMEGDDRPAVAQITAIDDIFAFGGIALGGGGENGSTRGEGVVLSVTHDNFSFSPVPEPAGLPLLLIGLVGILKLRTTRQARAR